MKNISLSNFNPSFFSEMKLRKRNHPTLIVCRGNVISIHTCIQVFLLKYVKKTASCARDNHNIALNENRHFVAPKCEKLAKLAAHRNHRLLDTMRTARTPTATRAPTGRSSWKPDFRTGGFRVVTATSTSTPENSKSSSTVQTPWDSR
jgi:hypothetical protein